MTDKSTIERESPAQCGVDATKAGAAGPTSHYSGEAYYAIDYVPDGEPVPWLFFILVYAYIAIIALACYL